MTRAEIAASLQGHVDAYSRALAPDVSVTEMMRQARALLRETARQVSGAGANSDLSAEQRAYATNVLAKLDEGSAQ